MKSGWILWAAENSMNACMSGTASPGLMLSGPATGSGPPTRAAGSTLRAPATK